MKKKYFFNAAFFFVVQAVFAQTYHDTIPAWLVPLRDAVYEQKLSGDEAMPIYNTAKSKAQNDYAGDEQLNLISRCEYYIARIYQFDKQNAKALAFYEAGLKAAEGACKIKETDFAWEMRAAHIAQLCTLRSTVYAIANGSDVEKFCKNALKLDGRNAHAQYMIASRWVYAPRPLNDTPRGIRMMTAILSAGDMQKDDLFNVYTALAYGYLRDKKNSEARPYIEKALEIYPTNKFVNIELKGKL